MILWIAAKSILTGTTQFMLMVEMPTWIEWEKYIVIFVNLYVY